MKKARFCILVMLAVFLFVVAIEIAATVTKETRYLKTLRFDISEGSRVIVIPAGLRTYVRIYDGKAEFDERVPEGKRWVGSLTER